MQILYISKNAAKLAFGRYRSCSYNRERASQSFDVIQFILSIQSLGSPLLPRLPKAGAGHLAQLRVPSSERALRGGRGLPLGVEVRPLRAGGQLYHREHVLPARGRWRSSARSRRVLLRYP